MKKRKPARHSHGQAPGSRNSGGAFWLYGLHAARAALTNPHRKIRRAVVSERAATEFRELLAKVPDISVAAPDTIVRLLPAGAVHQGIAMLCEHLPELDLGAALEGGSAGSRLVAVLDQVTDP